MTARTLTFTVTLTIVDGPDGPTGTNSDDDMRDMFAEYLTEPDSPFADDYSPDAWGGYDGPFVTDVTVKDDRGKTKRARSWPTFDIDSEDDDD